MLSRIHKRKHIKIIKQENKIIKNNNEINEKKKPKFFQK
jgi:hypothetical protein